MPVSYKRVLIQVPLNDVKTYESFAKNYGMSFSSAILYLAKSGLEQKEAIEKFPAFVSLLQEEKLLRSQKNKKASKIKK